MINTELEKLTKKALTLIQKCSLVINGTEYEIINTAIHAKWSGNADPLVTNENYRSNNTWFIWENPKNDKICFCDIDVTKLAPGIKGGIRINSLRLNQNKVIKTTGKIFKEIYDSIGEQGIKSHNFCTVNKENSPKLFLRKKANSTPDIFTLPRFGNFKNLSSYSERNLKFMFNHYMFTSDFSWAFDMKDSKQSGYTQYYPLVIRIHELKGAKFVIENKIATERNLFNHLKQFELGKTMNFPDIVPPKYEKDLGVKQISQLYGYYYSRL